MSANFPLVVVCVLTLHDWLVVWCLLTEDLKNKVDHKNENDIINEDDLNNEDDLTYENNPQQARHGRIISGRIHFWGNGFFCHVTSYYVIFVSFHSLLSRKHVWGMGNFSIHQIIKKNHRTWFLDFFGLTDRPTDWLTFVLIEAPCRASKLVWGGEFFFGGGDVKKI